ncbi:hypothetical protein RF11_09568 [Thelohanellus kitauei]|uniref:Uncharacterized protein n=1 Tax=Thelohanellus kitauei TaxID=669202 RepID=A0A0C2J2C2_THEKT|nr:hypothetical protein RF11_09568 [Thelohanellus kitauei]
MVTSVLIFMVCCSDQNKDDSLNPTLTNYRSSLKRLHPNQLKEISIETTFSSSAAQAKLNKALSKYNSSILWKRIKYDSDMFYRMAMARFRIDNAVNQKLKRYVQTYLSEIEKMVVDMDKKSTEGKLLFSLQFFFFRKFLLIYHPIV